MLIVAAAAAFPQASSTVVLSNGVDLELTADFGHPTGEEALTVEMVKATGNSFYRIFWDQNHLAVFAYRLEVTLAASGETLSAVAKPCEDDFAARYPDADGGKPVPSLSSERPLGALGSGQSATLELFNIPGMGLEVSDTVRMKVNQSGGSGGMRLAGVRVYTDHHAISGPPPPNAVQGAYVMFYIPGRGGFFFSAGPVPGRPFMIAGTIDHNRMQFNVENVDYECVASSNILVGLTTGDVWVYHDPSYQPEGNWTQDPKSTPAGVEDFFTAGSDSLGWWLPQ